MRPPGRRQQSHLCGRSPRAAARVALSCRATRVALADVLSELAVAGPGPTSRDGRRAAPACARRALRGLLGRRRHRGRSRRPCPVSFGVATQPSEPVTRARNRDVRALRPYVLRRGPLRTLLRRMLGVISLAVLDSVGLALGIYLALVLRSFVYGDPVLWSLLWRTEVDEWLPFLIPITLLVFWRAGLYAPRERRAGLGRVASSMLLVAAIVVAFGYGTGLRLQHDRADPDRAGVLCDHDRAAALRVRLCRGRAGATRARSPPRAAARRSREQRHSRAHARGSRGGIAYEFVDTRAEGDQAGPRRAPASCCDPTR